MHLELHHAFLASDDHAAMAKRLTSVGLRFGATRSHPGQGTANLCTYFENAYLELLFRRDDVPLEPELVRPLGLPARLASSSSASPIGLAFRAPSTHHDPRDWPFETWAYRPPYLREGVQISVVTPPGRLEEPLVFILSGLDASSAPKPDSDSRPDTTPGPVPWSRRRLARVEIARPAKLLALSEPVAWLVRNGAFDLAEGERGHWLTLRFDGSQEHRFEGNDGMPMSLVW